MSDAKTLMELAGGPPPPARLEDAAVVIIDAQNEYVDGALVLPDVGPALDQIALLLSAARSAQAPVIHIAHKGGDGGPFDRNDHRGKLADQAAALPEETVIEKPLPNAFAHTSLHEALEATGRKSLIIAGFMTHMCVSSTARAALDLGYQTTVLADASATRALPDQTGGPDIDAQSLHRAALAGLGDRFAVIAETAAVAK